MQGIAARGVHIEPNDHLSSTKARRYGWMGRLGEVLWNKPPDPIGVETGLARLTLDEKDESVSNDGSRALTAICATS